MEDKRTVTSVKKYILFPATEHKHFVAVIDSVTCIVPLDEDNTDYQLILVWVADGNTIADAD